MIYTLILTFFIHFDRFLFIFLCWNCWRYMHIYELCTDPCNCAFFFSPPFLQNDESHSVVLSGVINFTVCHKARLHGPKRSSWSRRSCRRIGSGSGWSGGRRKRPHKRISSGLPGWNTELTGGHGHGHGHSPGHWCAFLSGCLPLWVSDSSFCVTCLNVFRMHIQLLARQFANGTLTTFIGSIHSVHKLTHCSPQCVNFYKKPENVTAKGSAQPFKTK